MHSWTVLGSDDWLSWNCGSMGRKILISAGEASGDTYAALLVDALREYDPELDFFGCAGRKMRASGVQAVIRSESLAVVGIFEVLAHIPRIYRDYRKLIQAIRDEKPDLAILTDSPDFHLRVARQAAKLGIPVIYFVAPQVWAWRKDRLPMMRRVLTKLLCIFPFEARFFREHGIAASYVGHPLAGRIAPTMTRSDFLRTHEITGEGPLIALLPGSRRGEAARHLPALIEAAELLARDFGATFVLPASSTTGKDFFQTLIFTERIPAASIKIIDGQAWDALAHADLALAASGTVTVEAALLGTPMVTFYRVTTASWMAGKLLVRVPFYCMVNLVAGRRIVPELMQNEMTAKRLAEQAGYLLSDPVRREEMRRGLREVAVLLDNGGDAIQRAAAEIWNLEVSKLEGERIGFVS
jgi:lipid-A-disaccharide synthase